ARQLAAIEPKFVDVSVNDHYIRAITGSTLMLLTYDAERYAKRVSAVLHDCSVLGVPAVVPAGSTLADAAHYARIFAYKGPADFAATLLCAARALCRDPERSFAKANIARKIYGADVVTRITANPVLSMRIARIGPIANLVMPLWGRVGSSHIIEAQIAFLLSRGYFVQQVFVLDKPADKRESIPYFWRMLYENSRHTRGCVQRIAFPRREDQAAIETAAQKAHLDAYQAYEHILAHADLEDPPFAARMRKAEVTIVNHVFHSGFAFAHSTKNRILESHDIQSYNLSRRPLLDPVTGAADPLSRIMTSEMASVAKYDYVVNIVPEEDAVLSIFNRRTKLVTPYIPRVETAPRYPSVAAFATKIGLHESYQRLDRFDLLFVGDSHQNNLAAGRWLLERVFNPYLLDRGFNLAICGRASDALYKEFEGLASVFFAGFVEDLASVYALSRLVLLPDQTGTGISIKALEALAAGKPVIATPVAVRGFGAKLPADFAIHREPAAYADAIVAALSRPERLRELTDISHRSYAQISSREAVEDSWDEVFRTLGIAPPVRTHAPAPARARPRHGHALNGGGPLNGSHRDGASSDDRRAPQRAARAHGDGVAPASRPAPNILHERWSLQHGGGPSGWEACRALLRWVAEGADVIAATLPGSYIERRLRESVEQEHLFLHAVPLETDPRRRAPRRRPHQPSLILGDRDRDVVAPARPWPAAPREARNRIRTLDTLYAGSHRPGLIVIEDASAAGAILEGAKSLLRQAPAVLVCLASAGAQDRAAVWRDCVER
ncbi:MAG TPA: glycosyltransferase, partial [Steroidobacteraceae bacterium]|nr:glycosyltransferase [Steroidobacteraceae bacterium]